MTEDHIKGAAMRVISAALEWRRLDMDSRARNEDVISAVLVLKRAIDDLRHVGGVR